MAARSCRRPAAPDPAAVPRDRGGLIVLYAAMTAALADRPDAAAPASACPPRRRRFSVVTTCHAAGWEAYGRRMAETVDRHWPEDVELLLYHEGFQPDLPRARAIDLLAVSPELVAFKARHRDNPLAHGASPWPRPRFVNRHQSGPPLWRFRLWRRGYRWQAVRFAHKTFAILDAAARTEADVLIWIDADTRFFADVTPDDLESFVPADCFVGCLRRRIHTECGFLAYNLRHPGTAPMLDGLRRLYVEDGLFAQEEFHDSYLFDIVRAEVEAAGHRSHDIAGGIGATARHVLINSPLGRFMDHMKGGRKAEARSRPGDLVVARGEGYWTEAAKR